MVSSRWSLCACSVISGPIIKWRSRRWRWHRKHSFFERLPIFIEIPKIYLWILFSILVLVRFDVFIIYIFSAQLTPILFVHRPPFKIVRVAPFWENRMPLLWIVPQEG